MHAGILKISRKGGIMKRRITIFVCLICLLLAGFVTQGKAVAAAGNTYYVAKTGVIVIVAHRVVRF